MHNKTAKGVAEIRCPFFRCHSAMQIGCEGISADNSVLLCFKTGRDLRMHEGIFCAARYENCELYRAIGEQYGD